MHAGIVYAIGMVGGAISNKRTLIDRAPDRLDRLIWFVSFNHVFYIRMVANFTRLFCGLRMRQLEG
jgi:hypothetical protein